MTTFGRQVLSQTGMPVQVSADGNPEWKVGGLTVDWSTIVAVNADTTLPIEGIVVKNGEKYLRYGQILTKITATGKFGPYDPAANDGRQTLARGEVFILNETVLEHGLVSALGTTKATDHPGAMDGGRLWKDRILMIVGTHTLAAGPTVTEFEAVFPRVSYAESQ